MRILVRALTIAISAIVLSCRVVRRHVHAGDGALHDGLDRYAPFGYLDSSR
jgi:hypothetical protein